MSIKRNRRGYGAFAFVTFLILSSPCSSSAQRYCCEGDNWMKWTEEHREDYVRGYILGHAEGYTDACYKAMKYWPSPILLSDENNPLSRCLKGMPDFSRGPECFSKQITELYSTYPEDRILLITEVLTELTSGKPIQDIHKHPPFPTPASLPRGSSPRSP
jgi:hypothetical protein